MITKIASWARANTRLVATVITVSVVLDPTLATVGEALINLTSAVGGAR